MVVKVVRSRQKGGKVCWENVGVMFFCLITNHGMKGFITKFGRNTMVFLRGMMVVFQ